MKVLITGAGGQVGRALSESAPKGVETIALTKTSLDISDSTAVSASIATLAPDLVINAAAYTAVDEAERQPSRARDCNEAGARNLASAAAATGARLIHVSTDFVFDGNTSVPYAPEAPTAPLSVYGASKLAGEKAVLDGPLQGRGLVLRTSWVYAPLGRNFVLTMLRLMRERDSVRVVADQFGAPTSAFSIAGALWALSAIPTISGILHWTDSGVASWYDFAVAISEEAASCGLLERQVDVIPITTADYPTAARRPRFSVLDTRKTVDAIGIRPLHWRASLRQVLGEIEHG